MMKFKMDSSTLVSVGVAVGGLLLSALKMKDDANKKAAEKEEWIQEAIERISKKD